MADAPILADGAAAVPLEGGEDWSVVQEAAFVDAGGRRTLALARVGVFPGPRAAARLKNVTHLFAALQPSIDTFDAEPKPLLADVYFTARGGGGENAVAHERGMQAVLVAAMEYLFSREKCGGMRVAPGKAVCLPSVYSAASREADSGARGGAASSPSAPEAAAATATGAGETAGGAQGAEDGAKKRAHSEMEGAVDAAQAAASKAQAEKGPSATGGQPLFAVSTTVQWSEQYAALRALTQTLGQARSLGAAACADTLAKVAGIIKHMDTLYGVAGTDLVKEKAFTDLLKGLVNETQLAGEYVVGCVALYNEVAAKNAKAGSVEHETIRKKMKEARVQAGLHKAGPSGGGGSFVGHGVQPVALAPAFQAVAPFAQQPQQFHAQAQPMFGGPGHYAPHQYRGGGRGFGGGRRGGRGGRGGGRGFGSPTCGRCSAAGQPANHSYRTCPMQECYKCGQTGHIRRDCTN